jgi:hypothetical protein
LDAFVPNWSYCGIIVLGRAEENDQILVEGKWAPGRETGVQALRRITNVEFHRVGLLMYKYDSRQRAR